MKQNNNKMKQNNNNKKANNEICFIFVALYFIIFACMSLYLLVLIYICFYVIIFACIYLYLLRFNSMHSLL